jgi:hypothetical protein
MRKTRRKLTQVVIPKVKRFQGVGTFRYQIHYRSRIDIFDATPHADLGGVETIGEFQQSTCDSTVLAVQLEGAGEFW